MNFYNYFRMKSERKPEGFQKFILEWPLSSFWFGCTCSFAKAKTQRNSKSISSTERQTARLDGQRGKQLITVLPCPRPLATPYYLRLTRISEAIPFFLAFQKWRVQGFRFWALGRTRPKRFWWSFCLRVIK